MDMAYIVGLTGGIGSGKSTIANLFSELGVPIVDADVVARDVVAKDSLILEKIIAHFGEEVRLENGELNRSELRKLVFQNEKEKLWLNNLLHPVIREKMLQQLRSVNYPYVLWVVPLLIENKLMKLCDRVLVIDVEPELQILRASRRDSNSVELIKQMIQSQVNRELRLSFADDVIENNLPLEKNVANLKQSVAKLHRTYLHYAKIISRNSEEFEDIK